MTAVRRREVAPFRAAVPGPADPGTVFREAWLEENRLAIQASNNWVEKYGLPLAKHRQF
jgi:hypothetical protein